MTHNIRRVVRGEPVNWVEVVEDTTGKVYRVGHTDDARWYLCECIEGKLPRWCDHISAVQLMLEADAEASPKGMN